MEINLNQQCTVELTERGAWIINKFYRDAGVVCGTYACRDVLHEPLWGLMQIFGPAIHMGMSQVPFEGNKININPL